MNGLLRFFGVLVVFLCGHALALNAQDMSDRERDFIVHVAERFEGGKVDFDSTKPRLLEQAAPIRYIWKRGAPPYKGSKSYEVEEANRVLQISLVETFEDIPGLTRFEPSINNNKFDHFSGYGGPGKPIAAGAERYSFLVYAPNGDELQFVEESGPFFTTSESATEGLYPTDFSAAIQASDEQRPYVVNRSRNSDGVWTAIDESAFGAEDQVEKHTLLLILISPDMKAEFEGRLEAALSVPQVGNGAALEAAVEPENIEEPRRRSLLQGTVILTADDMAEAPIEELIYSPRGEKLPVETEEGNYHPPAEFLTDLQILEGEPRAYLHITALDFGVDTLDGGFHLNYTRCGGKVFSSLMDLSSSKLEPLTNLKNDEIVPIRTIELEPCPEETMTLELLGPEDLQIKLLYGVKTYSDVEVYRNSGHLFLTLPSEAPSAELDIQFIRPGYVTSKPQGLFEYFEVTNFEAGTLKTMAAPDLEREFRYGAIVLQAQSRELLNGASLSIEHPTDESVNYVVTSGEPTDSSGIWSKRFVVQFSEESVPDKSVQIIFGGEGLEFSVGSSPLETGIALVDWQSLSEIENPSILTTYQVSSEELSLSEVSITPQFVFRGRSNPIRLDLEALTCKVSVSVEEGGDRIDLVGDSGPRRIFTGDSLDNLDPETRILFYAQIDSAVTDREALIEQVLCRDNNRVRAIKTVREIEALRTDGVVELSIDAPMIIFLANDVDSGLGRRAFQDYWNQVLDLMLEQGTLPEKVTYSVSFDRNSDPRFRIVPSETRLLPGWGGRNRNSFALDEQARSPTIEKLFGSVYMNFNREMGFVLENPQNGADVVLLFNRVQDCFDLSNQMRDANILANRGVVIAHSILRPEDEYSEVCEDMPEGWVGLLSFAKEASRGDKAFFDSAIWKGVISDHLGVN